MNPMHASGDVPGEEEVSYVHEEIVQKNTMTIVMSRVFQVAFVLVAFSVVLYLDLRLALNGLSLSDGNSAIFDLTKSEVSSGKRSLAYVQQGDIDISLNLNIHFGPKLTSYYVDSAVCSAFVVGNENPLCGLHLETSHQSYGSNSIVSADLKSIFHSIDYPQVRNLTLDDTRKSIALTFVCDVHGSMIFFGLASLTMPIALKQFKTTTPELSLSLDEHEDVESQQENITDMRRGTFHAQNRSSSSSSSSSIISSTVLDELGHRKARYLLTFRLPSSLKKALQDSFDDFKLVLPKLDYVFGFRSKNLQYSKVKSAAQIALNITRFIKERSSLSSNVMQNDDLELKFAVNSTCGDGCVDLLHDEELMLKATLKCPHTSSESCDIISPYLSLLYSHNFDFTVRALGADFLTSFFGAEHYISRSGERSRSAAQAGSVVAPVRRLQSASHNVTMPFTFNSGLLRNTDSASQNFVSLTFESCLGDILNLDACEGSEGDTYMKLYNADGHQIASDDDYCGSLSLINYQNYQQGCATYTLFLGCYGDQSCSLNVHGSVTIVPPPTNVTFPFTFNSGVLADTNYAQDKHNRAAVVFNICYGDENEFTLDACEGSEGDTYMKLYNADGHQIASNDDYCGSQSLINYQNYQQGCATYTLFLGCYNQQSCSLNVRGYFGSNPTLFPTPSPTNPTRAPTRAPTQSPTQAHVSVSLPFSYNVSSLKDPMTVNFTICDYMTFTYGVESNTDSDCFQRVAVSLYKSDSSWRLRYMYYYGGSAYQAHTHNSAGCDVYRLEANVQQSCSSGFQAFTMMASNGTFAPTMTPTPEPIVHKTIPFEHSTSPVTYYDKDSVIFTACQGETFTINSCGGGHGDVEMKLYVNDAQHSGWRLVAENDDYCNLMPKITYTEDNYWGSYCSEYRVDVSSYSHAHEGGDFAEYGVYYGDDGLEGEICDIVDVDGMFGVSFCRDGISAFTGYDETQENFLHVEWNDTSTHIYTEGIQKHYTSLLYADIVLDHPDGLFEGTTTSQRMVFRLSLFNQPFLPFYGDLEVIKTDTDNVISYELDMKFEEAFTCNDEHKSYFTEFGYWSINASEWVGWHDEGCFISYHEISRTPHAPYYITLDYQKGVFKGSMDVSKNDLEALNFTLFEDITDVLINGKTYENPYRLMSLNESAVLNDDSFSFVAKYDFMGSPGYVGYCGNSSDSVYWSVGGSCPRGLFCDYAGGSYGRRCFSCEKYTYADACDEDVHLNARGKQECKEKCPTSSPMYYIISHCYYRESCRDDNCDVSSLSSIQCSADGQHFNSSSYGIVNGIVGQCTTYYQDLAMGFRHKSEMMVSCTREPFNYNGYYGYYSHDDNNEPKFSFDISAKSVWALEDSEGMVAPASKQTQVTSDLSIVLNGAEEVEIKQELESILYNDNTIAARLSLSIGNDIFISGEAYGLTKLPKEEEIKFAHLRSGFVKIEQNDWSLMILNISDMAMKEDENGYLQIGVMKAMMFEELTVSMVSSKYDRDFSLNMKINSDSLDLKSDITMLVDDKNHYMSMAVLDDSGSEEEFVAEAMMEYTPPSLEKLDIMDPINSISDVIDDVDAKSMIVDIVDGNSMDESYSYGVPSNDAMGMLYTAKNQARLPLDFSWFNETYYTVPSFASKKENFPVHFTASSCAKNIRPSKSNSFQYYKNSITVSKDNYNVYTVEVNGSRKDFKDEYIAIKGIFIEKSLENEQIKTMRAYHYFPNYYDGHAEVDESVVMTAHYSAGSSPNIIRLKTYKHAQAKGTKRVLSCLQLHL